MALKLRTHTVCLGHQQLLVSVNELENKDLWGLLSQIDQTITISNNIQYTDQFLNTFIHELLHLCFRDGELGQIKGVCKYEEIIVSAMATKLTELLLRNPSVVKDITTLIQKLKKEREEG